MILQVLPPTKKIRSSFAFLAMVVIQCPLASPWSFSFGRFILLVKTTFSHPTLQGFQGFMMLSHQLLILGWTTPRCFLFDAVHSEHTHLQPPSGTTKKHRPKKTEKNLRNLPPTVSTGYRFGRLLCHVGLSSCRWPLSSGCWGYPGEVPSKQSFWGWLWRNLLPFTWVKHQTLAVETWDFLCVFCWVSL